jgi:hypothetical protein
MGHFASYDTGEATLDLESVLNFFEMCKARYDSGNVSQEAALRARMAATLCRPTLPFPSTPILHIRSQHSRKQSEARNTRMKYAPLLLVSERVY